MKLIRTAIAGILSLLAATSALAQQFPTVPAQSVIGRLGVPGDSGPSSAIPISTLLNTRPLTAGQIIVGNGSGLQANVPLTGDATMSSAGAITVTKTNGVNLGTMATQNAASVAITGGTITGLSTPTNSSDAATKNYVDTSSTQCTSAKGAGFVGDGTTDNLAAWNTWKATVSAGGCLEFGVGKFSFSAAISLTMANGKQVIQLRGLGNDLSVLYWAAGGGVTVTQSNVLNSINIHDLTFSSGAVNTGNGLLLTSAGLTAGFTASQSQIVNVIARGDDYDDVNANTKYWAVGVKIAGWSNINIISLNTYGLVGAPATAGGGTGFEYGGVGTSIVGILNVYASNFYFHSVGVQLDDYWEGVTFRDCNFQGETGVAGLLVPSSKTHAGPLLGLYNNQFNTAGPQIDFLSAVNQLIMIGNTVTTFGNSATGATLGAGANAIIQGNNFNLATGTSTTALAMNGTNATIGGNIFNGTATGVILQASSTDVNISQNIYPGVTTQVSNLGTGNSVGVATK